MTNYAYWLVLALVAVVPLTLSLLPWQFRWRSYDWLRLVQVFIFVSIPFILLDSISHGRGWWAYNPDFTMSGRLLGLPVEEIMFFFVVPFACLYLYSTAARVVRDEKISRLWLWRAILGLFLTAGLVLITIEPKERTIVDVALFSVVAIIAMIHPPGRVGALWLLAVVGLFLIVNTVLTAMPIVSYEATYGSQYRLGTIPFEDTLYNFSLLLMCLAVWRLEPLKRLTLVVCRS